ncbi:nociceptin receptor-like [Diadema antillarum]|uniref:nociceptin receptor-like n=1 Tax=Diadema antillarum TaxID=105358 RepID=UPI003A888F6D
MDPEMTTSMDYAVTTDSPSNGTDYVDSIGYAARIVIATAFFAMAVVGIVGNIFVIVAVMFSRKLQTSMNVLVVSLSVADLLACLTYPFQGLQIVFLATWSCFPVTIIDSSSLGCSLITVTFIAVNRYILITKPRKFYQWSFTPYKMAVMVGASWLIAPILMIISSQRVCGVYIIKHSVPELSWLVPILLITSLVTILTCYILLFLHIKRHVARSMVSTPGSRRLDIDITKNLLIVICGFYACVLPYTAIVVIAKSSANPSAFNAVVVFFIVVLHLNSVINPIIYAARHPIFKPVFGCMITGRYSQIPEPSGILKSLVKDAGKSRLSDKTGNTSRGTESEYV